MSTPLATARLVRPAYHATTRPDTRSYTELLEDDLGIALDEIERLKATVQRASAAYAGAIARLNRQQEQIARLQVDAAPNAAQKIRRLTQTVAMLRATIAAMPQRPPTAEDASLVLGSLTLDLRGRSLVVGDRVAQLSSGELQMLRELFARPGAVFTSAELAAQMPGEFSRQSIRGFVRRIRVKLADLGAPGWLHSRDGSGVGGYWIAAPSAQP